MKRWIVFACCEFLSAAFTGCMTPPWSPDPTLRTQQLILLSEQYRMTGQDMSRLLLLDQTSGLNPVRVDGGVGP